MGDIKRFIETYLNELRTCIGQIPRRHWTLFPDFFFRPYIIRARKCSNGVAILFRRPSVKDLINVKSSKKRTEEIFLPHLPHPPYFAVFAWTNATRVKIVGFSIINFDFSHDPAKGKKFQRPGEDFHRMSVMRLEKSNEVQMMNCPISGVNDRGRVKLFIRFLWMMTGDCVELTEQKAKWYARKDFSHHLNYILFVWSPTEISETAKRFLIKMLNTLKNRFQELISRTDVDEQEIQDFLEDHKFIIDPNAKQVWSKENLGEGNQADFILSYADSIRVVEIKRPVDRIFDKKLRFSATARKALSELLRYKQWLESNEFVARGRYGSGVLKKGWGVMGRATEMSERELERLASWNSTSEVIKLKSFDDLLKNFDFRIEQVKSF